MLSSRRGTAVPSATTTVPRPDPTASSALPAATPLAAPASKVPGAPPPPHRVGQCAGGSLRFRRLGRRSRHGHPYQWAGGEEFRLCPRLLFSGVRCPPVRCPAHPRLPRRVAEAEAALPHLQGEGLPAADAAHRPPPGGRRRLPAGQAGAGAGAAGVGERPPPPGLREQAAKGGMCAIQFCAVSPDFMFWGFCRVSL